MNTKQNQKPFNKQAHTAFSVQSVLDMAKDFQNHCTDDQWKANFETFKRRVHTNWNRLFFIQEHPGQKMVQITYMHPMVTKNMTRGEVLAVTKPYPVHSMTLHIPSRELVYCFGPKTYVYSADE